MPDYFVIEQKFGEYISYDDHGCASLKDDFAPNGSDYQGSWSYKQVDNVIYWTFTSDFREHYVYSDGLFVPDVKFNYGGSAGNEAGELEAD